ncbi:hypothetical protein KIPB_009954 [Kipferlia bialata]|uniref:Uncharacterized protein n=1 Tax=Kipferlia bialata TaxID=797122 RepID=A0A9K3D511_9EUKA|nr:hypothetical protein KIPB_009954 [Kipferlia bialata]|eukprot:g9954.t1
MGKGRFHASPDTKGRALKALNRHSNEDVADFYDVSSSTTYRWQKKWDKQGTVSREPTIRLKGKFSPKHVDFVLDCYDKDPCAYRDEIRLMFRKRFKKHIALSTISDWCTKSGYTTKVLERVAKRQRVASILDFNHMINLLRPSYDQLVFCDEVSSDVRDTRRRRGKAPKGERIVRRVSMTRNGRVSTLAFLAFDGIKDYDYTQGTFTRHSFLKCIEDMVNTGTLTPYPELVFGSVKQRLKRIAPQQRELTDEQFLDYLLKAFQRYKDYDFRALFKRAGYHPTGRYVSPYLSKYKPREWVPIMETVQNAEKGRSQYINK